MISIFFFQAEDGIRDGHVTGVQTCALPISLWADRWYRRSAAGLFARDQLSVGRRSDGTGLFDRRTGRVGERSEEHTSELQSRGHLVCRLLLEKKKNAERRRGWESRTTAPEP